MKTIEVIGAPQNINGGLVKLTKSQAAVRAHMLKETKTKGTYEVTGQIQFKIGEKFGWDDQREDEPADDGEDDPDKGGGKEPSKGDDK